MSTVDYERLFQTIQAIQLQARQYIIQTLRDSRFYKLLLKGFYFFDSSFPQLQKHMSDVILAQDATTFEENVLTTIEFLSHEVNLNSVSEFNRFTIVHWKEKFLGELNEEDSKVIVATPRAFEQSTRTEEFFYLASFNPLYGQTFADVSKDICSIKRVKERYDELWLELSTGYLSDQLNFLDWATKTFKRVGVLYPEVESSSIKYQVNLLQQIFEGLFLQGGLFFNLFSQEQISNIDDNLKVVSKLDIDQQTKMMKFDCAEVCEYRFHKLQFRYWGSK